MDEPADAIRISNAPCDGDTLRNRVIDFNPNQDIDPNQGLNRP